MDSGFITRNEFPPRLLEWHGGPECLWFQGNRSLLDGTLLVSVIGTRSPSNEGIHRTRKLVQTLVRNGVTVVSGMAKGVDYVAHSTTLELGGLTIAVMGTPIEGCYPKEHRELKGLIAASGLVVSQFEPGSSSQRYNFPKRNETMAAMSVMTIVTEASATSGTRHQVAASIKLGRRVGFLASLVALQIPWIKDALRSEFCFIVESTSQVADVIEGYLVKPPVEVADSSDSTHAPESESHPIFVEQPLLFDQPTDELPTVVENVTDPSHTDKPDVKIEESNPSAGIISWIKGMFDWALGNTGGNRRRNKRR